MITFHNQGDIKTANFTRFQAS